jgi:hypothetical protein
MRGWGNSAGMLSTARTKNLNFCNKSEITQRRVHTHSCTLQTNQVFYFFDEQHTWQLKPKLEKRNKRNGSLFGNGRRNYQNWLMQMQVELQVHYAFRGMNYDV